MSEAEKQMYEVETESPRKQTSKTDEFDEYIFMIDTSCSMGGKYFKFATEALLLFVQSLPHDCRFNVISYGTSHQFLFEEERSVWYDDESAT